MEKMFLIRNERNWMVGVGSASSVNKLFEGKVLFINSWESLFSTMAMESPKCFIDFNSCIEIAEQSQFDAMIKYFEKMEDFALNTPRQEYETLKANFKNLREVGSSLFNHK